MANVMYGLGRAAFALGAWGASAWTQKYVQTTMPYHIMHGVVDGAKNRGGEMLNFHPYLKVVGEGLGTIVGYAAGPFVAQAPTSKAAVDFTATLLPIGVSLGAQYLGSKLFGPANNPINPQTVPNLNLSLPVESNPQQMVQEILQQAKENNGEVETKLLQKLRELKKKENQELSGQEKVDIDVLILELQQIKNLKQAPEAA